MRYCYQCFKNFENEYKSCPYCGFIEMNSVAEQRYLEPGILLQGRYLLGIVIGAGGFGITYAAWDQVLAQRVAIKEYLPGEFSTRAGGQTQVTIYGGEKSEQFMSGKEKFHEESKRLAKLRNVPGIVQIYDSFEENGTVYIVTEYLEGETLDARLKREGKIPEKEAVEIMLPVLQALGRVHKEGILHRDIAPNNIFLTKEGEVKLLDFGAARSATGSHSKSLTVLYKEGYTPEEQYRSRGDQGPWTDVYACAATLYKMLTGKIPPGAMERRRKDTLKEPSKNGAKVSREADVAILNALNVEVKYRTQSAEQFIKELTGEVKRKKHFIRTIEKKVGKLPLGVKIGAGLAGVLAGVFLILLFAGVIHFEISGFGNALLAEGKSRVPNVVNREIEEAQKKLEDSRLKCLIVDKQFSEEIPKDRILSQSVSAGKVTDEGTIIEVVVSGGVPNQKNGYELKEGEIFVPDVQYKSMRECEQQILDAGLWPVALFEKNDQVEAGKLIRQNIQAGEVAIKEEELILVLSSPKFITLAYDYIMDKEWESLNEIHTNIVEYMLENNIESTFYAPQNCEEMFENGNGLFLMYTGSDLVYYLGEMQERNFDGNGKYLVRCNCGVNQPFIIYEGEWGNGYANGLGTVNAHWNGGDTYRIEGNFKENYGEGTMSIQWYEGGRLYHGKINCKDSIIQEVPEMWYRQYFQLLQSDDIIYTYSTEADGQGIPWTLLSIKPGSKVAIWGLTN